MSEEDKDANALDGSFDASNPEEVKVARKRVRRTDKNRRKVVEALMQHEDGRRWLWQQMESCFIFSDPVVAGDTHLTYKNLGRQDVGKQLLSDCMFFSDLYVLMAKEARGGK